MKFEKQFPSLIGHFMECNGTKFRNEKTIQEYCLDKQKSKKIIEKIQSESCSSDNYDIGWYEASEKILKELKLDEIDEDKNGKDNFK